jgi:hypothetical protein
VSTAEANEGARRGERVLYLNGKMLPISYLSPKTEDYSVECKCGAPNCRKILTGKDWQRPELQKRYVGYFSAYLARKIAAHCHSEWSRGIP